MTNKEISKAIADIEEELFSRMDDGETQDQNLQDAYDLVTSLIDYFLDGSGKQVHEQKR